MNRRSVQAVVLISLFGFTSARAGVVVDSFSIITTDPQQNLFASIGEPIRPSLLSGLGAVEEWPVTINLEHLHTLPETVVLNLPDQDEDTLSRIRSRSRPAAGFQWSGGGEGCSALLSAIPGQFRALISCQSGNYAVETTANGVRLTRHAYAPTPVGAEDDVVVPTTSNGDSVLAAPGVFGTGVCPGSPDEQIDVLILYSANVRQALQAANINVQQYMEDTLATTQLAMDRSTTPGHAVIAELNLAHAHEVARNDNSTMSYDSDLEYLATHITPTSLRGIYSADLVMLIREAAPDPSLCGLANVPNLVVPPGAGFAPSAVGVTKRECSFAAYPFQHEFGHLFGGGHNPENNSNQFKLRDWAQAHWANANNPEDSARTLLSYQIGTCHGTCPQVLQYSNAAITLNKIWPFHTGIVGSRENALIIEEFAPATAQYRCSLNRIFADGFDEE